MIEYRCRRCHWPALAILSDTVPQDGLCLECRWLNTLQPDERAEAVKFLDSVWKKQPYEPRSAKL